jgi:multidrug efflux pump subunit AcrA (membrane-fusion protein)
MKLIEWTWLLLLFPSLACGVSPESRALAAPAPGPATVEHPRSERDISIVKFTQRASDRLKLDRAEVAASKVPAVRLSGGEVVVPLGHALTVSAPVSGELRAANREVSVTPGARIRRGETLFTLVPFAPVDRDVRARAERELAASQAHLAAADARVSRISQVDADRAVSRRAYEEAVAARDSFRADVSAAEARAHAMRDTPLLADVALPIRAPSDGVVRTLAVLPGQSVSAGTVLIDIVQVNELQIRVPVYAGDLARLELNATARVRALSAADDATSVAQPIAGPPTAIPERATVDRYYALPASAAFSPGERVLVELPLRLEENLRSVPSASLIYDASGTAWVYACAGDRAYQRVRIDPLRQVGEKVLFQRGPALGACIAKTGASEIFGSEFEPGH